MYIDLDALVLMTENTTCSRIHAPVVLDFGVHEISGNGC
jgi:hypothetical protein